MIGAAKMLGCLMATAKEIEKDLLKKATIGFMLICTEN